MDGWGQAEQVENILRQMLHDLFEADSRGARRDKLARAHGYTDGYMKALVDLGVATEKELLQIVLQERQKTSERPQPRQGRPDRHFVKVSPAPLPAIECGAGASA
jgi:hypothetical protein